MLDITVTFCLGSTVTFTLINVSPGSLWKILVYDLNLEDTGHIGTLQNYTLLCCCLPGRILFILLQKFCIGRCVSGDHISDVFYDNWKALKTLSQSFNSVAWFFLHYLPGLYSSKLSKVFLRIHQLKLQRCSALTVNGLGSVCCKCLCYMATVVYVCRLLMWKWMIKLDVVA